MFVAVTPLVTASPSLFLYAIGDEQYFSGNNVFLGSLSHMNRFC